MSSKTIEIGNRGAHWRISALSGVLALLAACTAGDEIATTPEAGEPNQPRETAPVGEEQPAGVPGEMPHGKFTEGSCDADLLACGGDCVDVRADASNCGSCGHSCGGNSCSDGICNLDSWAHKIAGDYSAVTKDVALAPDGDIVVVGSFFGKIGAGSASQISEGGDDAFVAKLSAAGELQWVARFGGEGAQTASAVAIDADGRIAVVGHFDHNIDIGAKTLWSAGHDDVFVATLAVDGGVEWARSFGDASDTAGGGAEPQQATSVAFDHDGNLVLAGVYGGTMQFDGAALASHGWQDSFIAKLDIKGQSLWAQAYAGPGNVAINDVAIDNDNEIVTVGRFSDTLAVGNGTKLHAVDGNDVLVTKLSQDGTTLWANRHGDQADEEAVAVAIEPISNHILLAGNGSTPFFMRLEADGTLFQGSSLPSGSARITDIDVTSGGNVWAVGLLNGELDVGMGNMVSEGTDALVILLNGEMQPTWSHRYGDAASDRATAVVGGDQHDAIVVGDFSSSFTVEGPTLVSEGMSNTFVAGISF